MAKRAPGRSRRASGRTTPKGTGAKDPAAKGATRADRQPPPSGRYTPPVPRVHKVSPPWVPVLLFGFLLGGAAVIVLNYLSLLPGEADNRYLLLGLMLITGGFVTATKYH